MLKDSNIEPRAPEQRLQEAEVNGRHLRGKNFVSRIAHLFGEDGSRFNMSGLDLLGFFARGNRCGVLVHRGVDRSRGHGSSLRNRRFQGAQADLRGTQVRYLVNLEDCVHIAASLKDFLDLVGGDCVNAAAEGVELDHLKVRLIAHAGSGLVQARMVGPLVAHAKRALQALVDNGVLGQNSHSQSDNDLGNTVVDFGIEMVGTARQDDSTHSMFAHPLECFAALFLDFSLNCGVFFPGLVQCAGHFLNADVVAILREGAHQVRGQVVAVTEVDEGADELHAWLIQAFHVVADNFGVGCNDRAVEVVIRVGELLLEVDAGVPDRCDSLVQQGFDVSVDEFGRVAHVFRRDRFHSLLEELVVASA